MSTSLNNFTAPVSELIRTAAETQSAMERTNEEFDETNVGSYEQEKTGRRAPKLQDGYIYNVGKNGVPFITVDPNYLRMLATTAGAFLQDPRSITPTSWTMLPEMRDGTEKGNLTTDGKIVHFWAKQLSAIEAGRGVDPEGVTRVLDSLKNDIAWNAISAMDSCLSLCHRAALAQDKQQDITTNEGWIKSLGYAQTAYFNAWKMYHAFSIAYGSGPEIDFARAVGTQTKRTKDYLHSVFCATTVTQANTQSSLNERFSVLQKLAKTS